MARALNKLTARKVSTITSPGRHSDGGGLYLIVDKSGARRWAFIYRWKDHPGAPGAGRLREMGLGGVTGVSLAKARERAQAARELLAEGKDPISAKQVQRGMPTFGAFAEEWIESRKSELKSDKSLARWKRSLHNYAAPLKDIRIDAVTTDDVLRALKPSWTARHESAAMARGTIETVLDAAKARGLRHGENPARWKGHLDQVLPRRTKLTRGHHSAMPYAEVPAFMAELRKRDGAPALALELTILTGARTSQVLEAQWDEIDMEGGVWSLDASRMKAGRAHRVPLAPEALQVLRRASALRRTDDYVFPGIKEGKPLSQMSMTMLMRRMKKGHYTVHGFRSALRDWCGDETDFPREVAEAALAHAVGDATEAAYRRSDALEKRRTLMTAWATFCGSTAGK
jgi:integrase